MNGLIVFIIIWSIIGLETLFMFLYLDGYLKKLKIFIRESIGIMNLKIIELKFNWNEYKEKRRDPALYYERKYLKDV